MFQGQATDIQIQAEEIIKLKKQINNLYVKHTGLQLEKIGKKFPAFYLAKKRKLFGEIIWSRNYVQLAK